MWLSVGKNLYFYSAIGIVLPRINRVWKEQRIRSLTKRFKAAYV